MLGAEMLAIERLSVAFERTEVLTEVSLAIAPGEILGVTGESGSGKSLTALAVLGLVPPPGRITSGRIMFDGRDMCSSPERTLERVRGREIGMVFQEPMTALNPVFTVGEQVAEVLRVHAGMSRRAAWARAGELFRRVGIPDPRARLAQYPHELSGGMRQRALIAAALACRPRLLIADEPTTALDVTIQAQILALLLDLQREFGMAMLLITHDLGVVAQIAARVAVMYAGRVVEQGLVADVFDRPAHPYTRALLQSVPARNPDVHRLPAIPGNVPAPADWPGGCRFRPRCPDAIAACAAVLPPLVALRGDRAAACIRVSV
jgi:oligopeptide/dipeptide ABC transporter ATP-binding protein